MLAFVDTNELNFSIRTLDYDTSHNFKSSKVCCRPEFPPCTQHHALGRRTWRVSNKCVHTCGDLYPALGKRSEKQVQRTAFAICPLYFGNRIVSTRNGLGDGTGSDVGKITVQNLHLFPLLVLPLDHVLASGLGSHPPYYVENA